MVRVKIVVLTKNLCGPPYDFQEAGIRMETFDQPIKLSKIIFFFFSFLPPGICWN